MEVLLASEVLEPPIGGAERTMLEWRDGLRARGHAATTVSLPPDERPEPERYWRWRAARRAELGAAAEGAIGARRPDVVVAQLHGAPAVLAAARAAGVPGVLALPSYEGLCKLAFDAGSDCPPRGDCVSCPAAARLAPAEREALAAGRREHDAALADAAALIAPSRPSAAAVKRWSGREAEVVWPIAGPAAPAGADFAGPVVCAAARWGAQKGSALLPALVAATRGRERLVTEVGLSEAERAELRSAGARLVPTAPIDALLAGASLVLVPSQWEEPFGRIAWEALARGVPALASAAGGLADAVPAELLVARRDDPAAWASAIRRLLDDRAAWAAAAAAGRDHAAGLLDPPPLERLETLLARVAAR